MRMQKLGDKWYLKDMARIIGTTYPHGGGWCINGEDDNGQPFTTWTQKESRAVHLLKKYTGYK